MRGPTWDILPFFWVGIHACNVKCDLRELAWLGWSEGRWVMSKSTSSHILRKFMSTSCCCLWREVAEFLWIPLMEILGTAAQHWYSHFEKSVLRLRQPWGLLVVAAPECYRGLRGCAQTWMLLPHSHLFCDPPAVLGTTDRGARLHVWWLPVYHKTAALIERFRSSRKAEVSRFNC